MRTRELKKTKNEIVCMCSQLLISKFNKSYFRVVNRFSDTFFSHQNKLHSNSNIYIYMSRDSLTSGVSLKTYTKSQYILQLFFWQNLTSRVSFMCLRSITH